MPDRENATLLLAAAGRDLQALKGMTDDHAFPTEVFGFHAQQAVEKALKAWLSIKDVTYPRTHNIRQLLNLLESSGVAIEKWRALVSLNAFAVQFRYDAYDLSEEKVDRTSVLAQVLSLVEQTTVQLRNTEKERG